MQKESPTIIFDERWRSVQKYSGTSPNTESVDAVMSPQKQQQMAEEAATSTGLNTEVIKSMLPILIPVVLQLLQTGATKAKNPGQVNNSVLHSFLDTDGDQDVDIADALSLAKRFLSK